MQPDPLAFVKWDKIADLAKRDPKNYLSYGAYWWSIKRLCREHGFDLGSNDDTEAREACESANPDPLELWYACVDHSQAHTKYTFRNGVCNLPDGTPYTLHDPDMFNQHAKL